VFGAREFPERSPGVQLPSHLVGEVDLLPLVRVDAAPAEVVACLSDDRERVEVSAVEVGNSLSRAPRFGRPAVISDREIPWFAAAVVRLQSRLR